jgi:hypothetical protein
VAVFPAPDVSSSRPEGQPLPRIWAAATGAGRHAEPRRITALLAARSSDVRPGHVPGARPAHGTAVWGTSLNGSRALAAAGRWKSRGLAQVRGDQRVPQSRASDSENPQVRTVTAFEVVLGGIGTLARENVSPARTVHTVNVACACRTPRRSARDRPRSGPVPAPGGDGGLGWVPCSRSVVSSDPLPQ